MDLTARLRSIVRTPGKPVRELTYEPDDGYRREAVGDVPGAGAALGGVPLDTAFGPCLVIDRRYEGDRWHGSVRIGECDLDRDGLRLLDPSLPAVADGVPVFLDLETTGLSGGAGTVAFLVGCGWFDAGAFQVRQFLLPSYSAERALLAAVAEFFGDAHLIVTYNGKSFDVPVMETRWAFHRIPMPLDEVPHFDMLHTARRLWRRSTSSHSRTYSTLAHLGAPRRTPPHPDSGCRLVGLERTLLDFHRVGDVPGFEIPARYFHFLRTGDAGPLEQVLEHNRLDLVSLAAVTARAASLAQGGHVQCRDEAEALALGRIYERALGFDRAEACYRRAAASADPEVRGEALNHLAIRCRRARRFVEAADCWRQLAALTEPLAIRRQGSLAGLRDVAIEALAIHHEHRARDLASARELALSALVEGSGRRADGLRHRLARLERKLAGQKEAPLFNV